MQASGNHRLLQRTVRYAGPHAAAVDTGARGTTLRTTESPCADRRRRVAILIESLGGGGAERVTLFIAAGLLARGHEVDLLLRDLVCDYPDDVPAGARVFFLPHRGETGGREVLGRYPSVPRPMPAGPHPWRLRFPRLALATVLRRNQWMLLASTSLPRWAAATAAYLECERPDAVLANMTRAVAVAQMAERLAQAHHRARIVAVHHNKFRSGREIRRARASYPYVTVAVGVSSGVSAELTGLSGCPRDRVHTVYNPVVSADLLRKTSEPAGHPWLDEPGPPVLLAIGRLRPQKDFPVLLVAFARLLEGRRARLILLGKGPLLLELRSLARELRITGHVDFPGFVANPYAFLARASLFVLSSRHEGLPTVLIEAMACGCPVVSTDCPSGPEEILEGGRWGELVPVNDPEALAAAMARGLDAPPRRDTLRERAGFFSIERAVDRYEELLLG